MIAVKSDHDQECLLSPSVCLEGCRVVFELAIDEMSFGRGPGYPALGGSA